jgi:dephospho-CoA kinase
MKVLRIALVGTTGVGKSTFVSILKKQLKHVVCKEIRLAKPLYQVQSYLYKICKTKKNKNVQDGVLLNFLGQHMRAINKNIIEEHFVEQLSKITNDVELVICSDVRPIDLAFVTKHDFVIINIQSDEEIALKRRMQRGDVSLANSKHWTEQQIYGFQPDYNIVNNGSIAEYENAVLGLVNKLYDFNRQGN